MFKIFELTILDVLAYLGLMGLLAFAITLIWLYLRRLEKRVQKLEPTFLAEQKEKADRGEKV